MQCFHKNIIFLDKINAAFTALLLDPSMAIGRKYFKEQENNSPKLQLQQGLKVLSF